MTDPALLAAIDQDTATGGRRCATKQPSLPKGLVRDADRLVTDLAKQYSRQQAAVWVHAGAVAQHAQTVRLAAGGGVRSSLATAGELHPRLAEFGDLADDMPPNVDQLVTDLWRRHTLMGPEGSLPWWSYPLGDLYQTLSTEAVKGRALCQTPWWVTDLLIQVSYDRAQELWMHPRVIDPACGTGHILIEAFHRARRMHQFHDGRSPVRPYLDHRPPLLNALDRVHGVDLDPYAATIAAWRLFVLAWAQVRHERHAPDGCDCDTRAWEHPPVSLRELPIHVAATDALLDEREPLLRHGQYEVVIANPPYITCKDTELLQAIRERYPEVCHRKFSLALPFHALMFDLCVPGGWIAQLTANSFMKREFGTKYVEQFLPRFDAQWVIDTSGCVIPGHGTPTVIMVHRNQAPTSNTVRSVQCGQGEKEKPAEPDQGRLWSAIRDAVKHREQVDRYARGVQASHEAATGQSYLFAGEVVGVTLGSSARFGTQFRRSADPRAWVLPRADCPHCHRDTAMHRNGRLYNHTCRGGLYAPLSDQLGEVA